jgi:hypothetical protein
MGIDLAILGCTNSKLNSFDMTLIRRNSNLLLSNDNMHLTHENIIDVSKESKLKVVET